MRAEKKSFNCEKCGFSCSKKSNFDKHLTTRKHILLTENGGNNAGNYTYINVNGNIMKNADHLHTEKCQKNAEFRPTCIVGDLSKKMPFLDIIGENGNIWKPKMPIYTDVDNNSKKMPKNDLHEIPKYTNNIQPKKYQNNAEYPTTCYVGDLSQKMPLLDIIGENGNIWKPKMPTYTDADNNSQKMPNFDLHDFEKKCQKPEYYICNKCQKQYKGRSGLWKHKTNCENIIGIIGELLQQNKEIKELLVKQNEKMNEMNSCQVIYNTQTNTHNHFNLNIFLNEKCKYAQNIDDFVNNIQIGMDDLENMGKLGYVEGISKIIMKHLNQLDIYTRPIHCTDIKRETIYIKHENAWNKENENKTQIKKAIEKIANQNIKMIPVWHEKNPDSYHVNTPKYEQRVSIMMECIGGMGGSNETQKNKNMNKVIKNISNNTYLEKNKLLKTI
jgi:hypothetical protein